MESSELVQSPVEEDNINFNKVKTNVKPSCSSSSSSSSTRVPPSLSEPRVLDINYLFALEFPGGVPFAKLYDHFHRVIGNPSPSLERQSKEVGFTGYSRDAFKELLRKHTDRFWVTKSPWDTDIVFPAGFKERYIDTEELYGPILDRMRDYVEKQCSALRPADLFDSVSKFDDWKDCILQNNGGPLMDQFDQIPDKAKFKLMQVCWEVFQAEINKNAKSLCDYLAAPFSSSGCLEDSQSSGAEPGTSSDQLNDTAVSFVEKMVTTELRLPFSQLLYAKIPELSEEIKAGEMCICVAGFVQNPAKFYLLPRVGREDVARLMVDMNKEYGVLEDLDCDIRPWIGYLRPGFYVAVRRSLESTDWYRGKILDKDCYPLYTVFLLDYGEVINVPLECMRYLHFQYISFLKAPATRCSCFLGKNYRNKRTANGARFRWTNKETKLFRSLIDGKNLAIELFKKRIIRGQISLDVQVHILDENCGRVVLHHVEREVLKRSRGGVRLRKQGGDRNSNHRLSNHF